VGCGSEINVIVTITSGKYRGSKPGPNARIRAIAVRSSERATLKSLRRQIAAILAAEKPQLLSTAMAQLERQAYGQSDAVQRSLLALDIVANNARIEFSVNNSKKGSIRGSQDDLVGKVFEPSIVKLGDGTDTSLGDTSSEVRSPMLQMNINVSICQHEEPGQGSVSKRGPTSS